MPADEQSSAANAAQVTDAAPAATVSADPALEKAISHGYVEQPSPSRDQRVTTLIADVEHAMANNAPISPAMLAEIKALVAG